MSGPLARLVAWLRSLGGDETAAAETDEPAPAAPAGVCTVCGTEVSDPDGVCSLCGSADVRRADADGAADPGRASTDAAAEPADDTDAAAEPGPGPARRSVADTTDDDAARLSELRRRGEADDDDTDDAEGADGA